MGGMCGGEHMGGGFLDLPEALYRIVAILPQGLENVCFPRGAI